MILGTNAGSNSDSDDVSDGISDDGVNSQELNEEKKEKLDFSKNQLNHDIITPLEKFEKETQV